jgi:threonine dehydratase
MSDIEIFRDRARAAMVAMRQVFPATPLMRNDHLSEKFGAEIWLKREDLTPVRSYKLRGAFNAMRRAQGADLFVCASAGNHAQGMAYMCRHFGKRGVIFMPVTTPQQKIDKTRIFGGDLSRSGWWAITSMTPWPRRKVSARPRGGISWPPLTMTT